MINLETLKTAAESAMKASLAAKPICSVGGCGRVYVVFTGTTIYKKSKICKVLESVGFKMFARPYHGKALSLYAGYDNASGLEWNKGEKIAEAFNNAGIPCFVDGDSD